MPKLIALIKAKPELSRQQFIDYYESNHAPLVKRLLPMIGAYRRNYLSDADWQDKRGAFNYDVLTELWFEDQPTLDVFYTRIGEPDVLGQIRTDEANFLQSDATRMFEVEERPRPPGPDE